MINLIRQSNTKINRISKYCDYKLYNSFYDLNTNYKNGVIYASLDFQSKYFIDEDIRENVINYSLTVFAKNKYRSYCEVGKLGIPVLKSIMSYNPLDWCFDNSLDLRHIFDGEKQIVIKPNDGGMSDRVFLTDIDKWQDVVKEKMRHDTYILCQEYIEDEYDDLRIIIREPKGIVDYFGRIPSNTILGNRNYDCRKEIALDAKVIKYVDLIRNYLCKYYYDKYMFYSIDFYLVKSKIIFGEVNNSIGLSLVSEDCIKDFVEYFGGENNG